MKIVNNYGKDVLKEALMAVVFHDNSGYYKGTEERVPNFLNIAVRHTLNQFLLFLLEANGIQHGSLTNALGDNIFHLVAWKNDVMAFDMLYSVCKESDIVLNVMNQSGVTPFELAVHNKYYELCDHMLSTETIQYQPLLKDVIKRILKGSSQNTLTLCSCLKFYGEELITFVDTIENIPSWASHILRGYRYLIRQREKAFLEAYESIQIKKK
eukprot:CAMPEP_0117425178 /NCGR_PEP_ID=MMETSP0758-20121206/5488_1 /TAXON_ID=63605 /ORGANISM="Percolomonas cosmopolitus, Strain AE-1 (ATCC 50343)" /LENGTH=211 /DNA_ID=CAMNT_0005209479 /DNA_START=256 /DNA_END=891 /DNA_ORIENTATION=+